MVEQLVIGIPYIFDLVTLGANAYTGEVVSKTATEVTIKTAASTLITINEAQIIAIH